jgi:hypothetical protein
MTGRGFAELVDDLTALTEIASDAGVSVADARRVLAAAGRQPAVTVMRLCRTQETSATRENRRAG